MAQPAAARVSRAAPPDTSSEPTHSFPMRRVDQLFLGVAGAVFLGLGSFNLLFPAAGMAGFEMQVTNVSALNEARANYGGWRAPAPGAKLAR